MRSPDFIRRRAREMRRAMTESERTLWSLLRGNEIGLHFRRQHPVGPYILDFCCATAKFAVEVDGPAHDDRKERDQRRTDWLAREGIRVIRFSTTDIGTKPAAVLSAIALVAPPSTA